MATMTAAPGTTVSEAVKKRRAKAAHRLRVAAAACAAASLILFLGFHGYSYYLASLEDRPFSPLHTQLRSSGTIGLKLGMLGLGMFCILFLYPLRKRWKWLGGVGSTRHWLDFHVIVGISAPILISFHAAFKFQGVAGLAYWIMVTVALSGFVGRYVYAQIPRSLSSASLSMAELEAQTAALAADLNLQSLFPAEALAPLLQAPSPKEIRSMNLARMLWTMLGTDLARPFRVAALRRRILKGPAILFTLGGLFASHNQTLESVIGSIRRQSWLRSKMAFLDRTQRVFHLWHVIHRPFSFSFVALVLVHLTVVLLLGYF